MITYNFRPPQFFPHPTKISTHFKKKFSTTERSSKFPFVPPAISHLTACKLSCGTGVHGLWVIWLRTTKVNSSGASMSNEPVPLYQRHTPSHEPVCLHLFVIIHIFVLLLNKAETPISRSRCTSGIWEKTANLRCQLGSPAISLRAAREDTRQK